MTTEWTRSHLKIRSGDVIKLIERQVTTAFCSAGKQSNRVHICGWHAWKRFWWDGFIIMSRDMLCRRYGYGYERRGARHIQVRKIKTASRGFKWATARIITILMSSARILRGRARRKSGPSRRHLRLFTISMLIHQRSGQYRWTRATQSKFTLMSLTGGYTSFEKDWLNPLS